MHTRAPLAFVLASLLATTALGYGCSSSDSGSTPEGTGGAAGAAGSDGGAGDGTAGTGGGAGTDGGDEADAPYDGPLLDGDCDPLVPTECGFPFPSNVYLVDDPSMPSGKRVQFGQNTLPLATNGKRTQAAPFGANDGFSPGGPILTHIPGATVTGLPDPDHIADSLAADSPTVLLEADTGTRVPHFAELDMSGTDDATRALIIHPAVRLKDQTRYIVAIRDVKDANGQAIAPTGAFEALRDGTPSQEVSVEHRRGLYADIFAKLSAAGVDKSNLQIAWDFTTASRDNLMKQMVTMRDDALATVGTDGPSYTIDQATPNFSADIALKLEGTMTVPLYLDKPGIGASLNLDASGMPAKNGTATFPFEVLVPVSATTGTPAAILQYGHGLFGDKSECEDAYMQSFANTYGYVVVATNWIGMANEDEVYAGLVINSGDFSTFKHIPDREMQGFVNFLSLMRLASGKLAQDPQLQFGGASAIDPSKRFYWGNSQGGILGTCYMALTTDVTRGMLGVPGEPFSLLLNRSADFTPFFTEIDKMLPSALDQQLAIGLLDMFWDRAAPDGYSAYITSNMLPNTPKHDVLIHVAIGDHQVTPLGAHHLARTVGAKNIKPVNRSIYGIDEVDAPYTGSAMVEFDYGLPTAPLTNVPPSAGPDPHGSPRKDPAAQHQIDDFFRTGTVNQYCTGACGTH